MTVLIYRTLVLMTICSLGLLSCGAADQVTPTPQPEPSPVREVCATPPNLTLTDVNSLTDWINALPKPTSLPCFLDSLPRPLYLTASESNFSAQPSLGKRSPRLFIFLGDKLVLTVVMTHDFRTDKEGDPQIDLLELGFITNDLDMLKPSEAIFSIKGEYKFPVTQTLPYSAPYDKIEFDDKLSNCAFCHRDERLVDTSDGIPVYESVMLQPLLRDVIDIRRLYTEQFDCDAEAEPFRCAMYDALINNGPVYFRAFPEGAEFFD